MTATANRIKNHAKGHANGTAKKVSPADKAIVRAEAVMNDELKAAVATIDRTLDQLQRDEIRRRVEIGRLVVAMRDDESGRYGAEAFETFKAARPMAQAVLRPMVKIAEKYSDDEVERLVGLKHPHTGERLNWSHVWVLSPLSDKAKAFELAERAVANGWSSKDLRREVIRTKGKRGAGGRPGKKPQSIEAAVAMIREKTRNWTNDAVKTWLAPGGLRELYKACQGPGDKPPREVIDLLRTVTDELDHFVLQVKATGQVTNELAIRGAAAYAPRQVPAA